MGDEFSLIKEARKAIRQYTIDDSESYAFHKSDQKRYITIYKAPDCKFRIGASKTKKGVKITIKTPHTCTPATHYNSTFLTTYFAVIHKNDYIFISNRDKGIIAAVSS